MTWMVSSVLVSRSSGEQFKAKAAMVHASAPRSSGKSSSVVQLGAYSSAGRVEAAWTNVARKFTALRDYEPTSARFAGPNGVVYRLSVKGFDSRSEAASLCASLKLSGGSCFVRTVAGDRHPASGLSRTLLPGRRATARACAAGVFSRESGGDHGAERRGRRTAGS